jgi:hypothetical protein
MPTTILVFFEGGRVEVALHLPAQVLDDPALGPTEELLTDSALGVWAEIGMARIGS